MATCYRLGGAHLCSSQQQAGAGKVQARDKAAGCPCTGMATQGADKGQYLQYRLEHPEGTHQAGACCHIPCDMRGGWGKPGGWGERQGTAREAGSQGQPCCQALAGVLGLLGGPALSALPPAKASGPPAHRSHVMTATLLTQLLLPQP